MQQRAAAAQRLREQMAVNHDRVTAEALCLLESEQRAGAEKILADEGYESAAAVNCDGDEGRGQGEGEGDGQGEGEGESAPADAGAL